MNKNRSIAMNLDNQIDFIINNFNFSNISKVLSHLGTDVSVDLLKKEATHCLKSSAESHEDYDSIHFEAVYMMVPDFVNEKVMGIPMLELKFVLYRCNALAKQFNK